MEHVNKAREVAVEYVKAHHLEERFVLYAAVYAVKTLAVIFFRSVFYGYDKYYLVFKLLVLISFAAVVCAVELIRFSEPLLKHFGAYSSVQTAAKRIFSSGGGGGGGGGGGR